MAWFDESERPVAEERPVAPEDEPVAPEDEPVAPEDEPVTSRDEAGEPGGEEDASNEAERMAEKEEAEDEEPLARASRERDEYLDLARRTQADFENYRKRAAKEAAAAGERAKGGLVRELLPVVDNLERALSSAGEGEQHLAEGVRLVHSELIAVLERNGVEQFDPKGESFDPTVHDALSTRSQDGAEPGVVLDVVEKGYRANGSVLRPARVVVSG
jgi:molecular chaperone GrpE